MFMQRGGRDFFKHIFMNAAAVVVHDEKSDGKLLVMEEKEAAQVVQECVIAEEYQKRQFCAAGDPDSVSNISVDAARSPLGVDGDRFYFRKKWGVEIPDDQAVCDEKVGP